MSCSSSGITVGSGSVGGGAAASATYTDATAARARALQAALTAATDQLAADHAAWAKLASRTDPSAHQAKTALAPALLSGEAEIARLRGDLAAATKAVAANKALANDLREIVATTEPWLAAMLTALPTDADLTRAMRETRRIDRLAADLLARTEDRRFRRPPVDPYTELRTALEARLAALERLRTPTQRRKLDALTT